MHCHKLFRHNWSPTIACQLLGREKHKISLHLAAWCGSLSATNIVGGTCHIFENSFGSSLPLIDNWGWKSSEIQRRGSVYTPYKATKRLPKSLKSTKVTTQFLPPFQPPTLLNCEQSEAWSKSSTVLPPRQARARQSKNNFDSLTKPFLNGNFFFLLSPFFYA